MLESNEYDYNIMGSEVVLKEKTNYVPRIQASEGTNQPTKKNVNSGVRPIVTSKVSNTTAKPM